MKDARDEAASQALKARIVSRLTAHLATPREIVERWPLAVLLTIAEGIIPAGHC
jgi:hypothetical protein